MAGRDLPRDGLLGHWPGTVGPGGRLYDRSPEANHGAYGPAAKWVWFTNPRAVRFDGEHERTYLGYLGGASGRDIVVGTYDHDDRTYGETTLATDVSPDDHVGPAVFARNDGHLLALWSKHDCPWLRWRVTDRPEDPDSFGPVQQFDGGAICYPNPVQPGRAAGAPIYLFYRDRAGTGDGHPYYRVSRDGGESFEAPTRIITAPDGHYSVYWMAADRDGDIHLFFTDAEGPSTGPKWNVAYAEFDDGTLSAVDGTVLAREGDLPVSVTDLEVIYDASGAGHHDAWIWDCGVDADGNPAVAYATFPTTHAHRYRYARHDGEDWHHHDIVDAGRYLGADPVCGYFAGGMAMPSRDPDVVYASVTRGGRTVLERFETDDGGRTFASERVTPRAVADNFRPVVPERRSADVPVVWLAGAYNHLDGSQSSLRGIPGTRITTGGALAGGGHHGVSLGIDCYGSDVFERGLTLAASFETTAADRTQALVDLGDRVRLTLAESDPGSVTCALDGEAGAATCTVDGVEPGRTHNALAWWDGDTLRLRLDGAETGTEFAGRLGLDGERVGWTLAKAHHFDGAGLRGRLHGVALYNRPLSASERERLDGALAED